MPLHFNYEKQTVTDPTQLNLLRWFKYLYQSDDLDKLSEETQQQVEILAKRCDTMEQEITDAWNQLAVD